MQLHVTPEEYQEFTDYFNTPYLEGSPMPLVNMARSPWEAEEILTAKFARRALFGIAEEFELLCTL